MTKMKNYIQGIGSQMSTHSINHVGCILTIPGTYAKQAEVLLQKVAIDVSPICKRHGWTIETLREIHTKDETLLGMNIDCCEVQLRLRFGSNFLPYHEILGTALHELAHMEIGPHNQDFHRLVDQLENEYVETIINSLSKVQLTLSQYPLDREKKRQLLADAAEKRLKKL